MAANLTEHGQEDNGLHALYKGCDFILSQFVRVRHWCLPGLLVTLSVANQRNDIMVFVFSYQTYIEAIIQNTVSCMALDE